MERTNIERAVVLAGAAATFSFAALLDADRAQAADISTPENSHNYSFTTKTPLEVRTAEITEVEQATPEPTPLPQNYESSSGLSSEIAVFNQEQFQTYIESVKPLLTEAEQNQLSAYLQYETLRHDSLSVNSIVPNSGNVEQKWELMKNSANNSLVITAFSLVTSKEVQVVRTNGVVTVPEGSALFAYTKNDKNPDVAVLTPQDWQKIGAYPTNETGVDAGAQFVTYSSQGDITTIFDTLDYDSTGAIEQVSAQSKLSPEGKLVGGIKIPAFGFPEELSTTLVDLTKKLDGNSSTINVSTENSTESKPQLVISPDQKSVQLIENGETIPVNIMKAAWLDFGEVTPLGFFGFKKSTEHKPASGEISGYVPGVYVGYDTVDLSFPDVINEGNVIKATYVRMNFLVPDPTTGKDIVVRVNNRIVNGNFSIAVSGNGRTNYAITNTVDEAVAKFEKGDYTILELRNPYTEKDYLGQTTQSADECKNNPLCVQAISEYVAHKSAFKELKTVLNQHSTANIQLKEQNVFDVYEVQSFIKRTS